jgi:Holliday junction resolvasome RuvABC endonuclease subunit
MHTGLDIESGYFDIRQERGESGGMRFIRFRAWMAEIFVRTRPELVTYELPFVRNGATSAFLIGLATRVEEEAAVRKMDYAKIHLSTLKKWGTDNGAASKEDMIIAAGRIAGHPFEDDNEADAFIQLAYAINHFDPSGADLRIQNRRTP